MCFLTFPFPVRRGEVAPRQEGKIWACGPRNPRRRQRDKAELWPGD
ncbi:MAG: hypothetical protein N2378_05255 [Chloroflexaceae bacterium]|nr:hypothetical protein [Chloroflexaceae bacterium]